MKLYYESNRKWKAFKSKVIKSVQDFRLLYYTSATKHGSKDTFIIVLQNGYENLGVWLTELNSFHAFPWGLLCWVLTVLSLMLSISL